MYRLHVFVLCCFDARASFVKIMLSLFDFCAAKMNKNVFHQHARLSSCIKHCKLLVFCACFLSKTTPPMVARSLFLVGFHDLVAK